jgi:O-antigen ligase
MHKRRTTAPGPIESRAESMDLYRSPLFPVERLVGLTGAIVAGCLLVVTVDVQTKYKLAVVAAIGGGAILAALPERRILCVVLWVLIQPLSILKAFFVNESEGPQFSNPTIDLNISDAALVLLALFLVAETISANRRAFRWSRLVTILLALLVWSAASFAIHATFLADGFTTSAPLALLENARLLIFVLLIQSAIRTRGDVVLVLLAVGAAVLMQTATVGLSYSTGRLFNYAETTNAAAISNVALQGFDTSGGGALLRATGTFGQVNEQAIYHVVMTFPLIAFFAARNRFVRLASIGVVAGSALAVVLTFSRGAWFAFPTGIAVCVAIAARRKIIGRKAMVAGALLSMGACVALLLLAQPIYQRVVYGDTGATASRVRMLDLAADLFKAHPVIGVGPGEFDEAALLMYRPGFAQNQWVEPGQQPSSPTIGRVEFMEMRVGDLFPYRRPLPVHNKYVLVLSELGLPGLMIWLWLCAEFIRVAWRCSRSPDKFLSLLGIGGLGAPAAELVYMMVEHFHDDKTLELVLFAPAIMVAACRTAGVALPRSRQGSNTSDLPAQGKRLLNACE